MMRALVFILLLLSALLAPLPAFLLGALLYALLWRGYEVLCIGVYVDLQFGTGTIPVLYTLAAAVALVVGTCVAPFFRFTD
jgi:cation transport ATPase